MAQEICLSRTSLFRDYKRRGKNSKWRKPGRSSVVIFLPSLTCDANLRELCDLLAYLYLT